MRSFWVALGLTVLSGCRCAVNEFDDGFESISVLPTGFDDAGPPPQVTVGEGCWSQPIVLAPPLHFFSGDVALRASGDAVAVWLGRYEIVSREIFRDGGIGTRHVLERIEPSASGSFSLSAVEVASNAAGEVVAAWTRALDGGSPDQLLVTRSSSADQWSQPLVVSSLREPIASFGVGIDDSGRATAIWEGVSSVPDVTTFESHQQRDGGWSAPREIIGPGIVRVSQARLFVAGDGQVKWVGVRYGLPDFVVGLHVTTIDADGAHDSVVAENVSELLPGFVHRADGGALVIWTSEADLLFGAEYTSSQWQQPTQLTDAGFVRFFSNDSRSAVWAEGFDGEQLFESTVTGGAWSAPHLLVSPGTHLLSLARAEGGERRFTAVGNESGLHILSAAGSTSIQGLLTGSQSFDRPPFHLHAGASGGAWLLAQVQEEGNRPVAFFCPP